MLKYNIHQRQHMATFSSQALDIWSDIFYSCQSLISMANTGRHAPFSVLCVGQSSPLPPLPALPNLSLTSSQREGVQCSLTSLAWQFLLTYGCCLCFLTQLVVHRCGHHYHRPHLHCAGVSCLHTSWWFTGVVWSPLSSASPTLCRCLLSSYQLVVHRCGVVTIIIGLTCTVQVSPVFIPAGGSQVWSPLSLASPALCRCLLSSYQLVVHRCGHHYHWPHLHCAGVSCLLTSWWFIGVVTIIIGLTCTVQVSPVFIPAGGSQVWCGHHYHRPHLHCAGVSCLHTSWWFIGVVTIIIGLTCTVQVSPVFIPAGGS